MSDPQAYDYALASFDRTHYFVANYVWNLPKGGKLLGGGGFARALLDNWTISGVSWIASGNPGSYIGAAQVQGPQAALDRVRAIAQIEGDFFSALRVKGLVPVDSLNPISGHLHRVYGVGFTAIIAVRVCSTA